MKQLRQLIFTVILAAPWGAGAALIDVDFNNDSYGYTHGGPFVGPTMSGAAVLGAGGDQWNGISANSGSGISLIYANGSNSTVTMGFTSVGGYDAKSNGGTTPFGSTPYDALMEDYLFTTDTAQTISLSGLAPNSAYNLVLYNAGDNFASGRTTLFTVNGSTLSSTWNATSTSLIAGIDYVDFPSATTDGSGSLVITYNGSGSGEGDVNGFQIQGPPAPPPAPMVDITAPFNGTVYAAPATFTISVSAAVSGGGTVTNVQIFTNGVLLGSVQTPPFNLMVSNLPAGAYALTAVATAAGVSSGTFVDNVGVLSLSAIGSAYTWTTLAGRPINGSADGVGSAAQFNSPAGTAVDASGNIYVADAANYTMRKVTAAGVSSTIAGFAGVEGTADGVGANARFGTPVAVAVDGAGNLYVADAGNSTIRKLTPVGTNWVVSTIAGLAGVVGSADGTNSSAQFGELSGIALDSATNLYVTDAGYNTVRMVAPMGTNWVVTTLAGGFAVPSGIAVDSATNLYVADTVNEVIRKITPAGTNWVVSTYAGVVGAAGTNDGLGTSARFYEPSCVAVDSFGVLYVTDNENNTIRKINPSGANGLVSTLAGSPMVRGSADGTGGNAQFNSPEGITVDLSENLYVADQGNNAIRKCTSAGVVTTLAGAAVSAGSADGVGSAALFNDPDGISVDSAGNVYVADAGNNTIRSITLAGEVTTLAGFAGIPGTNDGVGSNARFNEPSGLAFAGTIFVADFENNTIRRITPAGTVTTIAGLAGNSGSADGTNSTARFSTPQGVAVDTNGIIYVADSGNDTIRKIRPSFHLGVTSWIVTTIAGTAGQSGTLDGTNSGAHFYEPSGIAVDASGNLFVIGYDSIVRKITPVGTNWVVSTIANLLENLGTLNNGIAVDAADNVYVLDFYRSAVFRITPAGTNWLTSIIGGMLEGVRGSKDGPGSIAQFNNPTDIAVDSAGNVYVADSGNNTIRKGVFTAYSVANVVPYTPPPATGQLQVTLLPAEANGQWRFPWELAWRASGSIASNLVPGSYAVQFRNLPGYLAVPPNLDSISVSASGITSITNQYYPTINASGTTNTGGLTVLIGPNLVNNSGWHFVGDPTDVWYPSGFTTNELNPGTYFIEFKPINGYSPPPSQAVSVFASQVTSISVNYTLAQAASGNVLLPVAVPNSSLGDLADYPFGFNGQLQTDVGYGSGVAVSTNVVLTAAHLVFNDQTLSYVNLAYWFWQQEASGFTAVPQPARGWYILSGYAAQRTNDLLGGLAPDESSPQSRNEDVAALYFDTPVAAGGFGGYLPSDAQPNIWLTSTANKMLAGYPVDGSVFGTNVINGQMYEVGPQPYPLSEATDPVADQQIYTATWFLSYPGNSGGPFYVQLNGYYYPAGVYLGTLYNGIVPYASLVRGIDSNVVNLINLAATLGSGTNNSGGVIVLQPSVDISASNPGRIFMQLGPPAAVAEGAAWELAGDANYSTATNYVRAVTTTNVISLVFKPIPGWNVPASQNVSVTPNVTTVATATYTASSPTMLAVDSSLRLGLTGTIGTTYAIQSRASLTSGSWVNVSTNSITTSGFNLALPKPTNNQTIFYRALWLGY